MIRAALRRIGAAVCVAALLASPLAAAAQRPAPNGLSYPVAGAIDGLLARHENDPVWLRAFFTRMPKGGDLHNHASGAVYAEQMLTWAAADKDCVNAGLVIEHPTAAGDCELGFRHVDPLADHDPLIDAWSMNAFVPHSGETGHDHFFATFAKFGPVLAGHDAGVVAAATRYAAADRVAYLELMVTFGGGPLGAVAKKIAVSDDLAATLAAMNEAGLPAAVDAAAAEIAELERARRKELGCDARPAPSPCAVVVRYLQQAIRTAPPAVTYAQLALGFALAKRPGSPVVGVNLVAPEDDPRAIADYNLHMRMIRTLHAADPNVNVSLHAGELTLGLVPRADLADHIRQAVEIAGAKRIGHGVDVAYEDDAAGLLREMREKHVMVEIAQTSNDGILGVRGREHPLPTYLASGVPTALATDDEGVSRNDLTNEYVRAVTTFHLSYTQLKTMVRNSVHYGFLPGASLWTSPRYTSRVPACERMPDTAPSTACTAFLAANPHAAMEARVETELTTFELETAHGRTMPF